MSIVTTSTQRGTGNPSYKSRERKICIHIGKEEVEPTSFTDNMIKYTASEKSAKYQEVQRTNSEYRKSGQHTKKKKKKNHISSY